MSDIQDRRFEKYNSMTTAELEEMLRLDANAPEYRESDEELIFYIMGVLADRKRNEYTDDAAQKALDSFRQYYMPIPENVELTQHKPRGNFIHWTRRLTAVAAAMVLVLGLSISANASSFKKLWNVFARWTQETFCFVIGADTQIMDPRPERQEDCMELKELLLKDKYDPAIVPSWIPENFVLEKITKDMSPYQERYQAFYVDGEKTLTIFLISYLENDPQKSEIADDFFEIYQPCEIQYYLINNNDKLCAFWTTDCYQCSIFGDLSIEELKLMIDSIEKG